MRCGLVLIGLLAIAACSPQAQEQVTREAARATVTQVVTTRFPGMPVEPAINCIIDTAEPAQLIALASDAVTGPNEGTVQTVTQIAAKPETLACLAADGLPALLR